MKRILVASDLSIRSDRAVGRAVRIAARLKAGLTALCVVDSAMPTEIAEMVRTQAEVKLERFVASRAGADKIETEVICVIGDPVDVILETAQKIDADLLVLGMHRFRVFFDSVLETTMERLVRLSATPTLLVTDASDHDYARVLAGVDMSPACTKAIRCAHALVPAAEFTLFHSVHIPFKGLTGDAESAARMRPYIKEAETALDEWIAASGLPTSIPRPTILEGSPSAGLSKLMPQSCPDLLVLGAHSRSGLGRWILGGFTKDLVREPPCDLLVAR